MLAGDIVLNDYIELLKQNIKIPKGPLSEREGQILKYLAEGIISKEIAQLCSISVSTVDTHKKHIMEKLDMYTIAELTKYAIREGLTSIDV